METMEVSMKNHYIVLLRNNKVYIRINQQKETLEYHINDIPYYPNVPFYVHLFSIEDLDKELRSFVRRNLYTLKEKLFNPEVFVLIDDDTVGIEYTAIKEFLMQSFKAKTVYISFQYLFVAPVDSPSYVCISKSSRMFILSYIKNLELIAQEYLPRNDYTIDEMKEQINHLHQDCRTGSVPIYLNGDLSRYSSLGKLVDLNSLLANAQASLSNVDKTRFF